MSGTANLTPKRTVFLELEKLEFHPSDDQLQDWRDEGLITQLVPIPGTTEHGFTDRQRERFLALLSLCKLLKTQRPRRSELAFWLCWYGASDVPPEAVCDHVDKAVASFLRMFHRERERKGGVIPYRQSEQSWERVGKPWGKWVAKWVPVFQGKALAQHFFAAFGELSLRALLSRSAFFMIEGQLRRLVLFINGGREVAREPLQFIWNTLIEGMELLALPKDRNGEIQEGKNVLLAAVREVNATDSSQIIQIVHDAKRVFDVAGSVLWFFRDISAAALDENKFIGDFEIVKRSLPTATCAVLAHLRNHPHAILMREKLREGDTADTELDFQSMKIMGETIVERTSLGAHTNE